MSYIAQLVPGWIWGRVQRARSSREGWRLKPGPHKLLHITHGRWASIHTCLLGTVQSIPSILDCREDDASAVCRSTFCLENA